MQKPPPDPDPDPGAGAGAGLEAGAAAGPRPRIGISGCLLGEEVRFDGGHKRDRFLTDVLREHVDFVSVCPEAEFGLGVPRESLRLVGDPNAPRMVGNRTKTDITDGMRAWSRRRADELGAVNLHGYVLKKSSPSCGLFRVKVYPDQGGRASQQGVGLFAAALTARLPLLPVEEEGRLCDAPLRENFIERVFAYVRWTEFRRERPTPRRLVAFHSREKYGLLAHSPQQARELGRLVGGAGRAGIAQLTDRYGRLYMQTLGRLATRAKHTNVLHHLAGHLKTHLDSHDRQELDELILSYRRGLVPLVVPMTLLRHHFGRHDVGDWAREQVYLSPYPRELLLRNHV